MTWLACRLAAPPCQGYSDRPAATSMSRRHNIKLTDIATHATAPQKIRERKYDLASLSMERRLRLIFTCFSDDDGYGMIFEGWSFYLTSIMSVAKRV
jgi:hypothetical protein